MSRLFVLFCLACSAEPSSDSGTDAAMETQRSDFAGYAEDGQTVARVDPNRYLGIWYEFATTPSQQQQWCNGTTAEYSLIDESTIGVVNRCYQGSLDGALSQVEGTARPIDDTFARLLVDLGYGFETPYQIIELDGSEGDEPYAFAAVTSLNYQTWILSRTPDLSPVIQEELWNRLESRGWDVDELIQTEHRPTED